MSDVIVRSIFQSAPHCTVRRGTNADYTPGGNFNIFNVTDCILVSRIWGRVRVACTGAALVPFLNYTPAGGGGATALCALAVGAAHAVDVILTWAGTVAGVLTPTATLGHSAASGTATETFSGSHLIVGPGIISVTNATADATAVIDWYILWMPTSPESAVAVL